MPRKPQDVGFIFDENEPLAGRWVLFRLEVLDDDFSDVDLTNAGFLRSVCRRVSYRNAICVNVVAHFSEFYECDFTGANLRSADLRGARFERCSFDRANLEMAELRGAQFPNCTFVGANFVDATVNWIQSIFMALSADQRKQMKRVWRSCGYPPGG